MRNKKVNLDCEVLEIFSLNLKYYRKAAGLTQFELAKISGCAHNFINDIENRKKGASFETVGKIAKVLNVEPFYLFINPKDRFNGENQKLVGYLNAFNRNINSFIENTVKELSSNNDKLKK
jgi:transcriptional regulator with XRE-family HTH domain